LASDGWGMLVGSDESGPGVAGCGVAIRVEAGDGVDETSGDGVGLTSCWVGMEVTVGTGICKLRTTVDNRSGKFVATDG
jgi:hypothetical protein